MKRSPNEPPGLADAVIRGIHRSEAGPTARNHTLSEYQIRAALGAAETTESKMHVTRSTVFAVAAAMWSLSAPAFAQEYKVGSIVINQPWTRATPAGADVGAGFMTITNTGNQPDRLIGGALPEAGRFQVHEMKMEGGIMQMREIPGGLEIKPGEKVELKPGGYHVMFMDLHDPLKQGETLKGQLRFEKAGTVDVQYKVEAAGAQGPSQHGR